MRHICGKRKSPGSARLACWFRRLAETIFFWEVREGWDAFASTRDACATRQSALPRRDAPLGMTARED